MVITIIKEQEQHDLPIITVEYIQLAIQIHQQANKGLIISADGNTLSFNGSVIAGTGSSNGAANGSVNYSAGNPILWGQYSNGAEGGFYSDGSNIYWRVRSITLGPVAPS
ncbi:MAG: hypothetical protein EZS28_052312 [Streblomastix strix]|uniref:Uncharacterized protein n=1 Tax=Streblomastix strix TaxID=222440 RepID=A0A5J4SB66_9EUKA|nr:MAG: hypothetical protein EZS28_052312 [Streblomastix strix]